MGIAAEQDFGPFILEHSTRTFNPGSEFLSTSFPSCEFPILLFPSSNQILSKTTPAISRCSCFRQGLLTRTQNVSQGSLVATSSFTVFIRDPGLKIIHLLGGASVDWRLSPGGRSVDLGQCRAEEGCGLSSPSTIVVYHVSMCIALVGVQIAMIRCL